MGTLRYTNERDRTDDLQPVRAITVLEFRRYANRSITGMISWK